MFTRPNLVRASCWLGGLGLLMLFPDVALHMVLNLLHGLVGSLELTIEHIVQETFDVSRHTSQAITAWLGLSTFVSLGVWLYPKVCAWLRSLYRDLTQRIVAYRARLVSRIRLSMLRLTSVPTSGFALRASDKRSGA